MNLRICFIALFLLVLLTTGHVAVEAKKKKGKNKGKNKGKGKGTGSTKKISVSEVAMHNTPGDGWVIVGSSVYDVSKFSHPGGSIINSVLGQDTTQVFKSNHNTKKALKKMSKYKLGKKA